VRPFPLFGYKAVRESNTEGHGERKAGVPNKDLNGSDNPEGRAQSRRIRIMAG